MSDTLSQLSPYLLNFIAGIENLKTEALSAATTVEKILNLDRLLQSGAIQETEKTTIQDRAQQIITLAGGANAKDFQGWKREVVVKNITYITRVRDSKNAEAEVGYL